MDQESKPAASLPTPEPWEMPYDLAASVSVEAERLSNGDFDPPAVTVQGIVQAAVAIGALPHPDQHGEGKCVPIARYSDTLEDGYGPARIDALRHTVADARTTGSAPEALLAAVDELIEHHVESDMQFGYDAMKLAESRNELDDEVENYKAHHGEGKCAPLPPRAAEPELAARCREEASRLDEHFHSAIAALNDAADALAAPAAERDALDALQRWDVVPNQGSIGRFKDGAFIRLDEALAAIARLRAVPEPATDFDEMLARSHVRMTMADYQALVEAAIAAEDTARAVPEKGAGAENGLEVATLLDASRLPYDEDSIGGGAAEIARRYHAMPIWSPLDLEGELVALATRDARRYTPRCERCNDTPRSEYDPDTPLCSACGSPANRTRAAEERDSATDSVNPTHVREPALTAGVLDVLRNLDDETLSRADTIAIEAYRADTGGESSYERHFITALANVLASRTETDEVAVNFLARIPGSSVVTLANIRTVIECGYGQILADADWRAAALRCLNDETKLRADALRQPQAPGDEDAGDRILWTEKVRSAVYDAIRRQGAALHIAIAIFRAVEDAVMTEHLARTKGTATAVADGGEADVHPSPETPSPPPSRSSSVQTSQGGNLDVMREYVRGLRNGCAGNVADADGTLRYDLYSDLTDMIDNAASEARETVDRDA